LTGGRGALTRAGFGGCDKAPIRKIVASIGAVSIPRVGDMPKVEHVDETGSQRVVAGQCRHCGANFEATRPHQVFCRPSCRWEAFKAKRENTLRRSDPILFDA